MSDSDIYKEAMRRLQEYGERPAQERFDKNVESGLINKDGTLGSRLRDTQVQATNTE